MSKKNVYNNLKYSVKATLLQADYLAVDLALGEREFSGGLLDGFFLGESFYLHQSHNVGRSIDLRRNLILLGGGTFKNQGIFTPRTFLLQGLADILKATEVVSFMQLGHFSDQEGSPITQDFHDPLDGGKKTMRREVNQKGGLLAGECSQQFPLWAGSAGKETDEEKAMSR